MGEGWKKEFRSGFILPGLLDQVCFLKDYIPHLGCSYHLNSDLVSHALTRLHADQYLTVAFGSSEPFHGHVVSAPSLHRESTDTLIE